MADSSIFILPCEPVWEDSIYQLEVTDPVLAYNPATNVDGPANRQAQQLGNRTLYLRKFLEKAHTDGRHALTDADFVDGTRIPEAALKLDHGTNELLDRAVALKTGVASTLQRAEDVLNVTLSFSGAMLQLIPYSREYSENASAFELFTDDFNLRGFIGTKIVREIHGDDSLDVEDTAGIHPGQTYILSDADGANAEEVTVMSVLTEHRIRFTTELQYTRTSGVLSASNLIPNGNGATATGAFTYLSDYQKTLVGAVSGKLIVHRDNVPVTGKAFYQKVGSDVWEEAALSESRTFADRTVDDIYILPEGELCFRLEYTAHTDPYNVYYIVLQPVKSMVWLEDIRLPEIENAEMQGNHIVLQDGKYASLYDIPQKSAEVKISREHHFSGEIFTFTVAAGAQISAELPAEYLGDETVYVRLRYTDIDGNISRWSAATAVQL